MARYNVRISVPRAAQPDELLRLSETIYAKHQADGAASPLVGEVAAKWATVGPKLSQARTLNVRAKEIEKELEKLYQDRDLILTEVEPLAKQTRDLLKGYYGLAKIRDLGDHGYVVDDTPTSPKSPKAPKA